MNTMNLPGKNERNAGFAALALAIALFILSWVAMPRQPINPINAIALLVAIIGTLALAVGWLKLHNMTIRVPKVTVEVTAEGRAVIYAGEGNNYTFDRYDGVREAGGLNIGMWMQGTSHIDTFTMRDRHPFHKVEAEIRKRRGIPAR
jgi:hypothetical protein